MAAVSLFWNTNMAAVTSCENALLLFNVYFYLRGFSHKFSISCYISCSFLKFSGYQFQLKILC